MHGFTIIVCAWLLKASLANSVGEIACKSYWPLFILPKVLSWPRTNFWTHSVLQDCCIFVPPTPNFKNTLLDNSGWQVSKVALVCSALWQVYKLCKSIIGFIEARRGCSVKRLFCRGAKMATVAIQDYIYSITSLTCFIVLSVSDELKQDLTVSLLTDCPVQ